MGTAMWESDLAPHGVQLEFDDDRATIRLSGDVDVATGSALMDAATSAVARFRLVDIDLGGVTAMGEHGLRSLVKVRRFADAYRSVVAVVAASPTAADALREAGLVEILGFIEV